jgi:hypothetical protein
MGSAVGLQFHLEVTAEEAGRWADAYGDDLRGSGKSKVQLFKECLAHEPRMAGLASLLLDNFLASTMV